jgi:DMSO/TMAO reductase YedYZ molybdopterin-dependent catalytic subunit
MTVTRGFERRRSRDDRLPPGQYLERGFPVLSAGPTPHTPLEEWTFEVRGALSSSRSWTWEEFKALPREQPHVDIHCVTTWSKLDTDWGGVSVDVLLDGLTLEGGYVTAYCDGGYTTNLPVEDITGGKAWVVDEYDGYALEPAHGGPARLLVPHLYFWKSAKWVRGLQFSEEDEAGFWETLGYHDRGDPWLEQRYQGD